MMQFGIWEFNASFGLVGRPENSPELYITTSKLWDTEDTNMGQVWRWPIYFARQTWFTPGVADDFNKAFFYAHNFFEGQRPDGSVNTFEFDARTVQLQAEMLQDFFHDPGEDIMAEA